jgi:hypothetical protein
MVASFEVNVDIVAVPWQHAWVTRAHLCNLAWLAGDASLQIFRFHGRLGWAPEGHSKKWGMPESVPSARYSLVKGERIVRSVLSTQLRE